MTMYNSQQNPAAGAELPFGLIAIGFCRSVQLAHGTLLVNLSCIHATVDAAFPCLAFIMNNNAYRCYR